MRGESIRKDVIFFFAKPSYFSLVTDMLTIALLNYPSLPVAASYITIYMWLLRFIVTGSQTQPKEAIGLVEC